MRDVAVFLLFVACLPMIFKRPWIGGIVWVVISIMHPHRLAWNLAYDFPFGLITGLVTVMAMLAQRTPLRWPSGGLAFLLIVQLVWWNITATFALMPELVGDMQLKVLKMFAFLALMAVLLDSYQKIDALVVALVVSIGLYGVKGGLFTLLTGGQYYVWGPAGSILQGNNEIAVAILMAIPLLWYVQKHLVQRMIWRMGIWFCICMMLVSVLGTQSRGAVVAAVCVGLYVWLTGTKKLRIAVVLVGIMMGSVVLMPQVWNERVRSIQNYQTDASALGRINAWLMAINIANHRVVGGGYRVDVPEVFLKYAPDPLDWHAAHSIIFQILGEHGWLGLLLYLWFWWRVWWIAGQKRLPSGRYADLARMARISLIAYFSGGLFLSLAYFEPALYLVVLVVRLHDLSVEHQKAPPHKDSVAKHMA